MEAKTMFYYQSKIGEWMKQVFPPEIIENKLERAMRFFEEATELAQSLGLSEDQMTKLISYTMNRPVGEPAQEVGGVMVTLAALCETVGIDLEVEANNELQRISQPSVIKKIQAKQATKVILGITPEELRGCVRSTDSIKRQLRGLKEALRQQIIKQNTSEFVDPIQAKIWVIQGERTAKSFYSYDEVEAASIAEDWLIGRTNNDLF